MREENSIVMEAQNKKVKKEKPQPKVFYKAKTWVDPVFEVVKDDEGNPVLDRKGKEKIKIKSFGYWKLTHKPGTILSSGEAEYKVQKSGALVRTNKKPSKRDLHREAVRVEACMRNKKAI